MKSSPFEEFLFVAKHKLLTGEAYANSQSKLFVPDIDGSLQTALKVWQPRLSHWMSAVDGGFEVQPPFVWPFFISIYDKTVCDAASGYNWGIAA